LIDFGAVSVDNIVSLRESCISDNDNIVFASDSSNRSFMIDIRVELSSLFVFFDG
jgi:hypothetical protein